MKQRVVRRKPVRTSGKLEWLKGLTRIPFTKVLLSIFVAGFIGLTAVVIYFYEQDSKTIDRFLAGEIFQHTARLYARPYHIYPGQKLRQDAVVARLQHAGYEPAGAKSAENGFYDVTPGKVIVEPSTGESMRLDFDKSVLTKITKSKSG